MGGGHSEGPRSGQKRGRRSSLSDRGVFDTMLDDGVQDVGKIYRAPRNYSAGDCSPLSHRRR